MSSWGSTRGPQGLVYIYIYIYIYIYAENCFAFSLSCHALIGYMSDNYLWFKDMHSWCYFETEYAMTVATRDNGTAHLSHNKVDNVSILKTDIATGWSEQTTASAANKKSNAEKLQWPARTQDRWSHWNAGLVELTWPTSPQGCGRTARPVDTKRLRAFTDAKGDNQLSSQRRS